MADRIEKHPYYELDPGSPHMDAEDYQHMGLETHPGPTGELNPKLAEEVRKRLEQHNRIDADRIQVEVRGDTAVLTGLAPDRHARGRAEELAAEVEGIGSVINRIVVQPEDHRPGPSLTVREPDVANEPSNQRS